MDFSNAVAAAAPGVVRVNRASGIIWSNELIVTTSHAIRFDNEIEVAFDDGSTAAATLVGRDESTDLAVLRTDRTDLQAITFRDDAPRVVVLSAKTAARDMLRALTLGAADYLPKPFDPGGLVQTVARVLSSSDDEIEAHRTTVITRLDGEGPD